MANSKLENDSFVSYSGRLSLRIPKELHESLSKNAKHNGVSLNSYMNMLLSRNNERQRNEP